MRKDGVALEHHRNTALLGLELVNHPAPDLEGAFGYVFESGDHAEQGGLPAARRSNKDDELAIVDVDVDAFDDFDATERFLDALE